MQQSRLNHIITLASAVFTFFLLVSPFGAGAAEITVPTDYPTIQAAITAASPGDDILVLPGTYVGAITLTNDVTVHGQETARTFLSMNNGSGPIVTASGSVETSISNFTFINATTGILVSSNSSTLEIMNNVFAVGTSGTAIQIQQSPTTKVVNNTFYNNGTAVSADANITIDSNIFANNGTALAGIPANATLITYNLFYENSINGPTGTFPVMGDPLFANPPDFDFHVEEGSPCINAGDPALGANLIDGAPDDIGAYGGPAEDIYPFPVMGLSVTSITASSITLTWDPNLSYLVTNDISSGGYYVYYGYSSGNYNGTDANSGTAPSPIDAGPYSTYTLEDLNPASLVPPSPVLNQPTPLNSALLLTWSASTGALGYKVHYGITSPGENTIDVGNATTYTLTGLTNGQPYRIAVTAYAKATYYMVVQVYDSTFDPTHVSAYSPEVSATLGQPLESGESNIEINYPDKALSYPGLPNTSGSCFIATAAYGSYTAPEVLILRSFRDRYLLTSVPGRLLVAWYYHYGPYAATYLNAHPAFKPAVRALLMPVVAGAAFTVRTSAALKEAIVTLVMGSTILFWIVRKRRKSSSS